eukprot:6189011-Pleurochrysis_carterae.AAC.3
MSGAELCNHDLSAHFGRSIRLWFSVSSSMSTVGVQIALSSQCWPRCGKSAVVLRMMVTASAAAADA